ncbi:hypothetical protein Tco_0616966, partial [Tanacetum coccineum]
MTQTCDHVTNSCHLDTNHHHHAATVVVGTMVGTAGNTDRTGAE